MHLERTFNRCTLSDDGCAHPGSSAAFAYAHERYATIRDATYAATLHGTGVSSDTLLTPISPRAIRAFQRQWRSPHFSGAGNWVWTLLARRFVRKPRSFHAALWHGSELCGLCVGRVSKGRENLTLHYMESAPSRTHPLRGLVIPFMLEAATQYAFALGVKRLVLREPLPGLIPRCAFSKLCRGSSLNSVAVQDH